MRITGRLSGASFVSAAGVAALGVLASAGVAVGQTLPAIFIGSDDAAVRGGDQVEARFRADSNNWDARLEFDGTPSAGDNQLNVSNGRPAFEFQRFGFTLAYGAASGLLTFTIERPNGSTGTLSLDVASLASLNAIELATQGSRALLSVEALSFNGVGLVGAPTLAVGPGGPTNAGATLFFGNGVNLLGVDFELSGEVAFGGFTSNNPSEGARFTARLVDVSSEVPFPGAAVPAPAAGLALVGLGAGWARRRR